jgi:hypothetical protein
MDEKQEKELNQLSDNEQQDFQSELSGQGLDVFGSKDLSIPFIWILQKGSPQVEEQNPAYVPGAKAGSFFNSFTKRVYGPKLEVVPLYYEPVWLIYAPGSGNQKGDFKGRRAPGSIEAFGSPYDEGGMKDIDGNSIVDSMSYYIIIKGEEKNGPVVLSIKSSDLPHGKDWNTAINNTVLANGEKAAFFSSWWELGLEFNQNTKGTWYGLGTKGNTAIDRVRFITKEEFLSFVKGNREMILNGQKKADFALDSARAGQRALPAPGAEIPY